MSCNCKNKDCNCKKEKPSLHSWSDQIYTDTDIIWDESGFAVGKASTNAPSITEYYVNEKHITSKQDKGISYKYAEDKILKDLKTYLDKTYTEHYAADNNIECFDAWIALGDSTPTFRNTALKYLWGYGKKNGNNKQDLMKALHYIFMCLYVEHYRKDEK